MSMGLDGESWHWRSRAGHALPREMPALALDWRHSLDLRDLLGGATPRWTDALARETHRQLADALLAVEQAILLRLDAPALEPLVAGLAPGFTRVSLASHRVLLSPTLLRHLRQRAAIALVMRGASKVGLPFAVNDRDASAALSALNGAELAWQATGGGAGAARADLPAELFHDIAWMAAALIVHAIEQQAGGPSAVVARAVALACDAVIARHDEGTGAFSLALRAARLIPAGERATAASRALSEGRLLVFAALLADGHGLALDDVLETLLDGSNRDRMALLRLAGADEGAALAYFSHVAPIAGAGQTTADPAFLAGLYRDFGGDDAQAWLARRSGPAPLALRLALLDRAGS